MATALKKISILLTFIILIGLLGACGKAPSNIPVSELCEKLCAALGKTDMVDPGQGYVKGYLKTDSSDLGEYIIQKNVMGTSIDEFGIFKAGKLDTDELKQILESYLQLMEDSWMNYQPEEKPKLDNAEIKIVGDYVMYCILSDADRDIAFQTFSNELK